MPISQGFGACAIAGTQPVAIAIAVKIDAAKRRQR
jgi:hypothetical protein